MLAGATGTPNDADIDAVISGDIQALPSFVPGVGPFPARPGRWTQDPADLSPGQRNAAASLYLALVGRECLDLCGPGRSITIEGPLARNVLFASALAALTGVPVHASADGTGTSLGASLLFGDVTVRGQQGEVVPPLDHPGFADYVRRWRERV